MINSKYINSLTAILLVFAIISSGWALAMGGKIQSDSASTMYAETIFGEEIISLEIVADESDWANMLANAKSEEYIMCDIVVNGTKFSSVGIRPKGNSSLTQVSSSSSPERYSFKIKMDEYITDQTCFGLDSFVINNMISDPTYLKEYLSYDMLSFIGVETPLMSFVDVSVNGEEIGFYLALETYNTSFLNRAYGDISGQLYSVKMVNGMGGGNDNAGGAPGDMPTRPTGENGTEIAPPDGTSESGTGATNAAGSGTATPISFTGDTTANTGMAPSSTGAEIGGEAAADASSGAAEAVETSGTGVSNAAESGTVAHTKPTDGTGTGEEQATTGESATGQTQTRGMGGGMNGGDSGGDMVYRDDMISSYASIFENNVLNPTTAEQQRVIAALEKLSLGEELETYFDVDEILRYIAANTVLVNLDSYFSSMAQNYVIYEKNGVISILPWDYNLAFASFMGSNASSSVNFPIDTPLSGVTMESRPLVSKLLENETHLAKYHSYLEEILTGYLGLSSDGEVSLFAEKVNTLDTLISEYVKKDPTSFYTFENYEAGLVALKEFASLRARSIAGQLEGSIPSTTEGQANSSDLISVESLNFSDLGSQGGGGKGGNVQGERTAPTGGGFGASAISQNLLTALGDDADVETLKSIVTIVNDSRNRELTGEEYSTLASLGLTDTQIESVRSLANGTSANSEGWRRQSENNDFQNLVVDTSSPALYMLIVIPSILLLLLLLILKRYRHSY